MFETLRFSWNFWTLIPWIIYKNHHTHLYMQMEWKISFLKNQPVWKNTFFQPFREPLNLEKNDFFSNIKQSTPIDEESTRTETICEKLKMINREELTKMYLKDDVLISTVKFQNYRSTCKSAKVFIHFIQIVHLVSHAKLVSKNWNRNRLYIQWETTIITWK